MCPRFWKSTCRVPAASRSAPPSRLETAKVELAAESEFDVTIVNETVDQAAADLWSVIAKEYGL